MDELAAFQIRSPRVGYALALAHKQRRPPALISVPELQRMLVAHGIIIAFFNEVRYEDGHFVPEDAAARLDGVKGALPRTGAAVTIVAS